LSEGKNTALGLGLVTDVGALLVHANHDSGVLRASDDGGEDGARSIVTGEASLAHARATVYYERLYVFVVTHDKSRVVVVGDEEFLDYECDESHPPNNSVLGHPRLNFPRLENWTDPNISILLSMMHKLS
jgi:hypothetical protein